MEILGIATTIAMVIGLALLMRQLAIPPRERLILVDHVHDWVYVGRTADEPRPWQCRTCPARHQGNGAGGFGP